MSTLEQQIEFADNPEPRCACVLLLDTSGSMAGTKIDSVNAGLPTSSATSCCGDDKSRLCGSMPALSRSPMPSLSSRTSLPRIALSLPNSTQVGSPPWGRRLSRALDLLAERKKVYKQNQVPYYRPWLFLITDGAPTDAENVGIARKRLLQEQQDQHVTFFAIGVEGADLKMLESLTLAERPPARLKGLAFRELFLWLSQSMQAVSRSRVADKVTLPRSGWMEV